MAYPWYSTGKCTLGSNRLFKITLEENYETNEIHYVACVIHQSTKTGKKNINSTNLNDLHTKVQKYINKMESKREYQLQDIEEVFDIRMQLEG